jgi:pimeloyl-ACP methyl ester carboxylesterase
MLPVSFLDTLTATQPKAWFVFEGVTEGKGQLVITINKADGTEIGEGPGVWFDLKNIKKMYERATATPSDGFGAPYNSSTEPTIPAISYQIYASDGNAFQAPPDEEKKALVFVHGWNMSFGEYQNFSETMFKRLWWQGYRGRFCAFRWPTMTDLDSYNTSEHRAWKYGPALKAYVNSLPVGYIKNLAAHSMGNVVAGSALKAGLLLNNYALMQAAIPAGCYNSDVSINNYARFVNAEVNDPTPDLANPDKGYRGHLTGVTGNLINFYNINDFALVAGSYPIVGQVAWEQNQISYKPNAFGNLYYDYDPARSFAERYQLWQAGAGAGGHIIRRYGRRQAASALFLCIMF